MAVKKQVDYPPHVKLMMEPEDEIGKLNDEETDEEWVKRMKPLLQRFLGSSQK